MEDRKIISFLTELDNENNDMKIYNHLLMDQCLQCTCIFCLIETLIDVILLLVYHMTACKK